MSTHALCWVGGGWWSFRALNRNSLSSPVPAVYPQWMGCCWEGGDWGRCSWHCSLPGMGICHCYACPGAPSRAWGVPSSALLLPLVQKESQPCWSEGLCRWVGTNDPVGTAVPFGTCSWQELLVSSEASNAGAIKAGLFLGPHLLRTAHCGALIAHVMLISFFFFQWSLAYFFRN